MKRENASFLLGGILFGFIMGTLFAHQFLKSPAPAGFSEGMAAPTNPSDPSGSAGAAEAAGPPPAGGGGQSAEQTMQRVQREMAALKKALESNPKDAAVLGRMGDLYYDAEMFDKARDFYTQSLASDPKNPNISTDLGICFQRLGQADEALRRFRESIAIDPNHWQSWLNLGIVSLFDKNDTKTAEEAFAKVRALNPGFQGLPQLQQALDQAKSGARM
ncbi:MAG TPA: tetratricopeptide repeat protein [Candidatus Polarisedimenticolia bacterium]|jgi:predicted Zn-dependent protease|nr:tetratricopeptide repeat protein [Candidatus Polarisedimenticolia bacterium]